MKPILEVKGISKKFKIQREQQSYLSLRDSISTLFSKTNKRDEDFWALKNVSFNIYPGDSVGIIGRNGAGKSTLLKILSKITPPTSGKIISRGRIASLLEVGTGFHPELTGRENIYLNGAILGLKRKEIARQFDTIVDFSGVEKFIDTPLKHYSSGMQLRLAFAVAAHLEPEILIIDEVLAVGDAEFQKKCIGKMGEVSKSGRTILFVSHSISSIQSLSTTALFFEKGETTGIISLDEGIKKYLYGQQNSQSSYIPSFIKKDKPAYITMARLLNKEGQLTERFKSTEDIILEIEWVNNENVAVSPNFLLTNYSGNNIMQAVDTCIDFYGTLKNKNGVYVSRAIIPGNFLNTGEFFFHLALDNASPRICYDSHPSCLHLTVWETLQPNPTKGNFTLFRDDCATIPLLKWEYEKK